MSVVELNEFFGAVPVASREYIQMPGKWSIERFAPHILDDDAFLRTCRFKWAFDAKPDIVIHTTHDAALRVEAKTYILRERPRRSARSTRRAVRPSSSGGSRASWARESDRHSSSDETVRSRPRFCSHAHMRISSDESFSRSPSASNAAYTLRGR